MPSLLACRFNRRIPSEKAFTLIELLVVVMVISILALIGGMNLRMATYRAKVSKALNDMGVIRAAVEMYRMDNGALPPDIDGFVPFILTDALSRPIAYLPDNRSMKDPLNDFEPKPRQWRFQTFRYVNILGRLNDEPGLNSSRKPSTWLPISRGVWLKARAKYGDYLIASTHIKYKDNFKRDEAGRTNAMKKWNDFFWRANDGTPKFMELKHDPIVCEKFVWSGFDYNKSDVQALSTAMRDEDDD